MTDDELHDHHATSLLRRRSIPLAKPVDLFRKSTVAHGPKPMRVDVFGVVYQTKLAKQQIAKEFEMVQEYSSRLSLVKTREVSLKLSLFSFSQRFPMKVGQSEKNQNRNRFVDIIPYDDNYVSLQVPTSSSHIPQIMSLMSL